MQWYQVTFRIPPQRRGFHLITSVVRDSVPDIDRFEVGLLHLFIKHTSASLSINENADADVPRDLEMAFNQIASEQLPYTHTMEGPDDMPAHVKASLIGSSISIPIVEGELALGTWQGIYLCEHRDHAHSRTLVATLSGREWSSSGTSQQ